MGEGADIANNAWLYEDLLRKDKRIAALEADNKRLQEALEASHSAIRYIHCLKGETLSGLEALGIIDAALARLG